MNTNANANASAAAVAATFDARADCLGPKLPQAQFPFDGARVPIGSTLRFFDPFGGAGQLPGVVGGDNISAILDTEGVAAGFYEWNNSVVGLELADQTTSRTKASPSTSALTTTKPPTHPTPAPNGSPSPQASASRFSSTIAAARRRATSWPPCSRTAGNIAETLGQNPDACHRSLNPPLTNYTPNECEREQEDQPTHLVRGGFMDIAAR